MTGHTFSASNGYTGQSHSFTDAPLESSFADLEIALGLHGLKATYAAMASVRQAYKQGIVDLSAIAKEAIANGHSPEAVARSLVEERKSLKDIARGPLAPLLKGWHQPSADALYAKVAKDMPGASSREIWLRVVDRGAVSNSSANRLFGVRP